MAQDRADITQTPGNTSATLDLNISFGETLDGAGSPNALNSFTSVVQLSLQRADNLNIVNMDGSTYSGDGSATSGYVFHLDDFTSTFDGIGGSPLSFSFGTAVETTLTDYIVNTEDPGFVATLSSPDFLKFLNPTLTAVYVAPQTGINDTGTLSNAYVRGAHLTVNPLKGITLGGTFAQSAQNAGDINNQADNNVTDTVYGVDANASVSMFNLGFEWAQGNKTVDPNATGTNVDNSLLYAKLHVDGSSLPILNSLDANYRDIPGNWETNGFSMAYAAGSNSDNYPFDLNQRGFGVKGDLGLFILDVSGYYDGFDVNLQKTNPDAVQAYGADATAQLFAGFSLSGFFHHVTVNGAAVGDLEYTRDNTGASTVTTGTTDLSSMSPENYDTGFGVTLKHDGSASNALIKNLNLEATYKQTGADYGITTIDAKGDYTLNVSIVTLTPYAEYESVQYANTYTANYDGTNTFKVGAGLTTKPLDVPLQPSLMGAVNYRTTDHNQQYNYTATEMQWSVGLVLNKFLFNHSTLTAKYGSYSGQNIEFNTNTNGTGDSATDISAGDVPPSQSTPAGTGDTQQSVNGYEVIWNYYDLEFSYGTYLNNRTDATGAQSSSASQAFQISYTVDF
ncbi:MAG: hypothetical protein P8Y05_02600 [Deinococcales bacterium]